MMTNLNRVISHERSWQHIRDAFDAGVLETGYHSKHQYIDSGDRFTDCYSLGEGLEPGVSATVAGITASRPVSPDRHSCDDLRDAAQNPQGATWGRYDRYWHGYRIYSAPLASAFPIVVLKLLNLALLILVSATFFIQSSKLIGTRPSLALIAPVLFCSDYVRIWHVTPHTVSTAIIIGGSAIFAFALRRNAATSTLILISALFGSLFNFVDFLVNPPWMPMLLAFFVMASGRKSAIKTSLLCVGAWFVAYSVTWASKWIVAYIVDPSFNIGSDVLNTALFRIAGDNAKVLHFPLAASIQVIGNCLASWGTPLLIALVVFAWRRAKVSKFDRRAFAGYCWPALVPFGWFEILSNHSQIHAFFVSRSAAASIGVAFAAILLSVQLEETQTRDFGLASNPALKP